MLWWFENRRSIQTSSFFIRMNERDKLSSGMGGKGRNWIGNAFVISFFILFAPLTRSVFEFESAPMIPWFHIQNSRLLLLRSPFLLVGSWDQIARGEGTSYPWSTVNNSNQLKSLDNKPCIWLVWSQSPANKDDSDMKQLQVDWCTRNEALLPELLPPWQRRKKQVELFFACYQDYLSQFAPEKKGRGNRESGKGRRMFTRM